MATCDANGVIFVWIRFESRWSIELVNDRQHQVSLELAGLFYLRRALLPGAIMVFHSKLSLQLFN